MKTLRTTTAAAIVRFLQAQYVRRDGVEHRLIQGVFGIFGHGNVAGLGQALEELGGVALPFFQPKNEQAMVHTAIAYAKTKQRLSTFACTSSVGPGATNMITGAATATVNRLPVLLLPGDVFASRRPAPVLQQLEYPGGHDVSVNDCFRPVSRYWDRITRPEQLLTALPEAMRILSDPAETGAVTLALPEDVQAEAFDCPAHFLHKRVYDIVRNTPPPDRVHQAADLLRSARRPLLIAGGGVHYSNAAKQLLTFAEATGIPVAVTQAGKGALLESHPLGLGAIGVTGTSAANQLALEADVVLVVGTRLSDFTTASKTQFQDPGVRFISINVHAGDAAKHGAFSLVGDARATLTSLARVLGKWRAPARLSATIAQARASWEKPWRAMTSPRRSPDGLLYQSQVIRVLNELCDEHSTVVHAAGGIPGDIHKLWRGKSATDYHSEYGYSCMGYEIAGALGVKLAAPEREVYALVGDGSYLMLNHELVTAVQERLKITILLTDNQGYGCIHNLQRACGGRSFGNEFRQRTRGRVARLEGPAIAVDYPANARSLGAAVFTAHDEASLREALVAARAESNSCLVYVPVTPGSVMQGFSWWDVPPAAVSTVPSVKTARANYEKAVRLQRFYH